MSRLIWHRRDLRINDNELYHNGAKKIYSLFIFDPADYSPRPTGIVDGNGKQLLSVTHGPHFTRRLLDAVHSLRHNLKSLGGAGNLIIRHGDPIEVVPKLAQELQVEEVTWSEVPGYYEHKQSKSLKDSLLRNGPYNCKVHTSCTFTLSNPNNLPKDQQTWEMLARPKQKKSKKSKSNKPSLHTGAALTEMDMEIYQSVRNKYELSSTTIDISPDRFKGMPTVMGDVRRVARTTACPVRELFGEPDPQCIAQDLSGVDMGDIPSLEELTQPLLDSPSLLLGCLPRELIQKLVQSAREIPYNHGINVEKEHMQHLHNFVQTHAASADRSSCDVSKNDSSQLSIPLALGTLSPQQIYHCVKQQQNKLESDSRPTDAADINWIISHIEMRDYFLLDSFRSGTSAYDIEPKKPVHNPNATPQEWLPLAKNRDAFIQWASGQTNLPLVDAGMAELVQTGYTSNRVRQNIASVLTKDLKLDWRLGAEWFQICLEDHCVGANFGNWAYFAGVGGDPKNRHFRTISQAYRYDPEGKYVRKWIAGLRDCDENNVEQVLRPWDFVEGWDEPIVPPETQLTWQDRENLESLGRISSPAEILHN